MTTNETMLALHKLIGGVEWEEQAGMIGYTWTSQEVQTERTVVLRSYDLRYRPTDRTWRKCKGASDKTQPRYTAVYGKIITEYEAQALIKDAAIEWLIKQVEYFCIEHDTGQLWEVQWMMAGNDHNNVAIGSTLLEALHAAVREVKENK